MQQKRSMFGPLLLIAIGVLWLLIKSGSVPSSNLWALTHVWPFLLIGAGISLILRPYWSYVTVVMDILIVGGLILAIVYAPQLGWTNPWLMPITGNNEFYFGPGESGSGNMITETHTVSSFHAIEVAYPANVFIKQGNAESVKIEAEDNLMPNLRAEVGGGTLRLFYKSIDGRHINPTKAVSIFITVKDLDKALFSSAGDFTLENLQANDLEVVLNGAGNLELKDITVKKLAVGLNGAGSMTASGTVEDLDMHISGFGDFKGADLHAQTARVNISGAGSAAVWVDNELDAEISGAGSINYYGSPRVAKHIDGLGSVNQSGNK